MGDNEMKSLADALWGYYHEKYLLPYLSDSVCYFMARVTSAPSNGMIGIQRPFDSPITVPYAWSAESLTVGETCIALVFGDLTNTIVIGKGDLSVPGNLVTKYVTTFTSADWTAAGTVYVMTIPASAHGRGTSPMTQVQILSGSNYEQYYGFPSTGIKTSIDASGNITLTAGTAFGGKLIVI